MLIEPNDAAIPVVRQCALVGLARSSFYYRGAPLRPGDEVLMRLIDEQYTRTPFYGARRMRAFLRHQGYPVGRKRVQRLMGRMGLEAIYPKPRLSTPAATDRRYPYRLRHVVINRPNQVWAADITYIRMRRGFVYLTAILDWATRYVLAWRVSLTLDTRFCLEALEEALAVARPEIFNTDQGSQFTSEAFTERLEREGVAISWDGRGRALDNIFVERLWRSVKYEEVYLNDYDDVREAVRGLQRYFRFYNVERPHQALDYQTPATCYWGSRCEPREAVGL